MRVVVQRVSRAAVRVEGRVTGAIDRGFVVLAGFAAADADDALSWMAEKVLGLRVFANAQGKIGPNLDDAFAFDRKQGFKQSSIQNVVLDQIRIAQGKMPPNLLHGKDAQDVAAYVASVAGK